ncbi:site-specific DNA-methyltransferase, partial [Candidatus Parcubacteria bacterium]
MRHDRRSRGGKIPMIGQKEARFWDTLQNLFVGVPVEGASGYINLMRFKTRYFQRVMRPALQHLVEKELRPFPGFREELFDKLYTFFKRYISEETGAIGFFFTPYHQSVYERVYTDARDVVLFWKTQRLYYVKTDRLFRSMETEIDGFKFIFDASTLEHKRANEKRDLVFHFKAVRTDGAFVFTVKYSERGKRTSLIKIRRAIRDALGLKRFTKAVPSEKTLEHAFRVFERQSKVDYFLCKDARNFLREQFDLWMWQYLLGKPGEEPHTEWDETRLKQLQALKRIAYAVIDYIAAFEDEVVKIWNKPKLVLNSHYVITLDRILAQEGGREVLEQVLAHPGMEAQIREWRAMRMVDESFQPEEVWGNNSSGNSGPKPRYQHLPLDTRYFKELEPRILALFDDLDNALDGWLIKSENYQALRTILPKWKGKVQCIYIDPPFNKGEGADYLYEVDYKDATWCSMLYDRIELAHHLLRDQGAMFVRCDYEGNMLVRLIMDSIFGAANFQNEIIISRFKKPSKRLTPVTESLFFYAKDTGQLQFQPLLRERLCSFCKQPIQPRWHLMLSSGEGKSPLHVFGRTFYPPRGQHWKYSQESVERMLQEGRVRINESVQYTDIFGNRVQGMLEYLESDRQRLDSNWTDIAGYRYAASFSTENAEVLLKRVILLTTNPRDIVMDYFAGSGTTLAVAHKLKRRWIGIEMGAHFYTHILPRMKKVLYYDGSGISKDADVAPLYNARSSGGFFKYYEMEQFEQTLQRLSLQDLPEEGGYIPESIHESFQLDLKLAFVLQISEQGITA